MSFGFCPLTGKTFAEKFPASVYEAFPSPSPVTSELQFQRALHIEAALDANVDGGWKTGAKRYLFYVLNALPDGNASEDGLSKGGHYISPDHVRDCVFVDKIYPSDFRWFVIDPAVKEEVEYLATQLHDFWYFRRCDGIGLGEDAWWISELNSHDLHPREE